MTSNTRDMTYSQVELTRLAFGSCHSRGAINRRLIKSGSIKSTIWDVIGNKIKPQAFLWTGDAIYPPMKVKGDTPLNIMYEEYSQMLSNSTLGYATFIKEKYLISGVHGVWDDHDYGGNDRGRELKQREDRRDAYLDFLGVPISDNSRRHRHGLYSSIEFGTYSYNETNTDKVRNNRVKVIFLDTRWHREKHCIPSVGANSYIPFGAIISCITRWLTAGFDLPSHLPSSICQSRENAIIGEEQWIWLENELKDSPASVHIIVSSIQVLTTNPVVESWGHFPAERDRLLKLLNTVPGLIILSGDVHHAEISTTSKDTPQMRNQGSIIEVTSSGLTHSCSGPRIYGPFCEPILDLFPKHRFKGGNVEDVSAPSYYTGLNFGSIDFDWKARLFEVKVHNEHGDIVLSTGNLGMDMIGNMTVSDLDSVSKCIDGHFYAPANMSYIGCTVIFVLFCLRFCFMTPSVSKYSYKND